MARNLNEITHELAMTLNAHGFDDSEASNAISDALVKCLPSYQAMVTLALEAARNWRELDASADHGESDVDDIPY